MYRREYFDSLPDHRHWSRLVVSTKNIPKLDQTVTYLDLLGRVSYHLILPYQGQQRALADTRLIVKFLQWQLLAEEKGAFAIIIHLTHTPPHTNTHQPHNRLSSPVQIGK